MRDKVLEILKQAEPKLASVATATDAGRPAAAVVGYAVRDDGKVIISTHTTSHKWQNLSMNPEIGLVVGWGFEHPHVQLGGDAELVMGEAAAEVSDFYFTANPEARAFLDQNTGFVIITPTWARITTFSPDGPPQIEEGKP